VQAYVVGVPDQTKGEIVAAAVELRAGAATGTASIIASIRDCARLERRSTDADAPCSDLPKRRQRQPQAGELTDNQPRA
jgi:acyl-coenzyme A synthetase/AMP-(fatty) acid ligase